MDLGQNHFLMETGTKANIPMADFMEKENITGLMTPLMMEILAKVLEMVTVSGNRRERMEINI
jgi:hypothetical protein